MGVWPGQRGWQRTNTLPHIPMSLSMTTIADGCLFSDNRINKIKKKVRTLKADKPTHSIYPLPSQGRGPDRYRTWFKGLRWSEANADLSGEHWDTDGIPWRQYEHGAQIKNVLLNLFKKWDVNSRCGNVFGMWENLGQKSFRRPLGSTKPLMGHKVPENLLLFFRSKEMKGLLCWLVDITMDTKEEEAMGAEEEKKNMRTTSKRKGLGSLHAYLTSGRKKTPTIIV